MSENNRDKSLPDKDYFRNYKGEKKKREHLKLTDEEKMEFAKAFDDSEEEEEVKTYVPPKKASEEPVKVEPVATAAAASSREDLYALPEFDTDSFFATLGVKEEVRTYKKPDNEKKSEAVDDDSGTRTINLDKKAEEDTKKVTEKTDNINHTRHFDLRSVTRKLQLDKNKKSFAQNFRVLSKDREDRAIIEAAPSGKGGKGFADSVKPKKGEDIFEAVEKAYLNKDEVTQIKIENTAVRKDRDEKGLQRAEEIKKAAVSKLEKQKAYLIFYVGLAFITCILTVFFTDKSFYPLYGIVVSVALCALNFSSLLKSFKAIKTLQVVPETAITVMSVFVLFHNIVMLALNQIGSSYTLCLVFASFMKVFSDYFRTRNKLRFINMAVNSKRLSILQRIQVRQEAASFATTADGRDPDIYYCAKAFLDTSIEEPVSDDTKENKYYVFTMSVVLLASLIVGLLCFATQFTGISFVSALTATLCAVLPIMYDPMSRYSFYHKGKDMLKQGACVCGREALDYISSSEGFVLDARDVFVGEVSRFRKSAITRVDQNVSAVFTAALLNEAGSVLAPCFDSFVSRMTTALPEVENFQYEERLGYSAWINDRKILVGNRQMLLNHSITVPSKEHEKAYGKGRFVMYVVVDGEISATFLVNYKVLSSLRKYAHDFNKTGLVLMFSSKEAFLNEEIVAGKLSLDIASVKVLSSKATAVMEKYNSSIENQEPTGLLCSRKKRSIMHLIMGCYNLNSNDKFIRAMMSVGVILGIAIMIAAPILKMPVFINPVTIVILRLVWCGVITLITERRK